MNNFYNNFSGSRRVTSGRVASWSRRIMVASPRHDCDKNDNKKMSVIGTLYLNAHSNQTQCVSIIIMIKVIINPTKETKASLADVWYLFLSIFFVLVLLCLCQQVLKYLASLVVQYFCNG